MVVIISIFKNNIETKKRIKVSFYLSLIFLVFFILLSFIQPWNFVINNYSYPSINISRKDQLIVFVVIMFFINIVINIQLYEFNKINFKKIRKQLIIYNFLTTAFVFMSFYFAFKGFLLTNTVNVNSKYLFKSDIFLFFNIFALLLPGIKYILLYSKAMNFTFKQVILKWTVEIFILLSMLFFGVILWAFGWIMILFLFLIVWSTDIGAWFFGISYGKHKIAPKISPKKSYEGFLGAIFVSTILVICFVLIIYYLQKDNSFLYFPFINFFTINKIFVPILLILFMSIFGQIGDFVFSYFKRKENIKDYSHIFGPHGGFLDRFDSYIFMIFLLGILFLCTI